MVHTALTSPPALHMSGKVTSSLLLPSYLDLTSMFLQSVWESHGITIQQADSAWLCGVRVVILTSNGDRWWILPVVPGCRVPLVSPNQIVTWRPQDWGSFLPNQQPPHFRIEKIRNNPTYMLYFCTWLISPRPHGVLVTKTIATKTLLSQQDQRHSRLEKSGVFTRRQWETDPATQSLVVWR